VRERLHLNIAEAFVDLLHKKTQEPKKQNKLMNKPEVEIFSENHTLT
jgi:hypothetical protein